MHTKTKILLTISLTMFVIGLAVSIIDRELPSLWFAALPTAAIFFGLFMFSKILEKESDAYDLEQQWKLARARLLRAQAKAAPPSRLPVTGPISRPADPVPAGS